MILQVHSDAGNANEKGARSRAGGHFFLSNNSSSAPNNGAILTTLTIIKAVMSSAAEAELGTLFLNAKEVVIIRQILTKMGHPQPRTPIQTDNTTAEAVVNNRVLPKRLKAMDMRIHWLKCREAHLLYERTLGKPTIGQLANNQRREFKFPNEGFFPMTRGRFPSDISKLDSHK